MSEEIKNNETIEEQTEVKKSVLDNLKGFGKKAVDTVKDGIKYAKENPDVVADKAFKIGAGGVAILTIAAGIKADKKLQRTVYSEDIGECVELKRKLNNDDKKEVDYRVKTGQTKIEALGEMGLIK